MELRCYDDGRPLSPDEEAVLAVRRQADAAPGDPAVPPGPQEFALFHVDCYPAEPGEWVMVRQARAGLLHETPP